MQTTLILTILVIVFIAGYLMISVRKMKKVPAVEKNDKITDLSDKNFQNQIKNDLTLVDFWASWCLPCKMMAPVLNELADEVGEGVQVCKVDVEQYQSLASKYAIRGIPTMLLFKDGREINRFVGVKTKDFLLQQIRKAS